MKKGKPNTSWHTPKSPKGMGDYVGTGRKNPIGTNYDSYMNVTPVKKTTLTKPPKSLA